MPDTSTGPTDRPHKRKIAALAGLTLAVLLGHWAVLFGAPLGALRAQPPSAVDRPFTLRTISTAAPADTPVATRAQARRRVTPPPNATRSPRSSSTGSLRGFRGKRAKTPREHCASSY